jgi:lysine 2,3-aminomutase
VVGHSELLAKVPHLEAELLREAHGLFPVRVTRTFFNQGDPLDPEDPVLRQVLPRVGEGEEDPGDKPDPVGDAAQSPVPWVVSKHPDRVLLLLTKRCHLYCRYCFRRDHEPASGWDPTQKELEHALQWCIKSGAREVILSGGDPLVVKTGRLLAVLDRFQGEGLRVRIHTRAPITAPGQLPDELFEGLQARTPLWMVVHCNHAQELGEEAVACLRRLVDSGITVLNQSVLLAGVNDTVSALEDLSNALVDLGIKPYYLHLVDPVPGNAPFRLKAARALELHGELRQRVSGIALPALVVDLPDGSGKLDVRQALSKGVLG